MSCGLTFEMLPDLYARRLSMLVFRLTSKFWIVGVYFPSTQKKTFLAKQTVGGDLRKHAKYVSDVLSKRNIKGFTEF